MVKPKKRKNRKRKRHLVKAVRISPAVLQLAPPLPSRPVSQNRLQPWLNRAVDIWHGLALPGRWQSLLASLSPYWQPLAGWISRWGHAPRWLAACLALFFVLISPRSMLVPKESNHPLILASAYPEAIALLRYTPGGWLVRFKSGQEEWYHNSRSLSWVEQLDQPDLASILARPYPFGPVPLPRPAGQEPGRLRHYGLLRAAYGATAQEVRGNLEVVNFFGNAVWFNRRNGAAEALRGVVREIAADPELRDHIERIARPHWRLFTRGKTAGLFQGRYITDWEWRRVAGTQRLSAHSFGIAIDINNPHAVLPKYWGWSGMSVRRIEPVPWRLVGIFERYGFIWGGKWHHYDTMHFEYRPEFLAVSQQRAAARERSAPRPLQKAAARRSNTGGD